jgi:orotate phosphoribosyltransferase
VQDIAEILVKCEAVTFSTDPLYTYASGIQSPIYTDNRRLLGYPKERTRVVDELLELVKKQFSKVQFGAVAGTATAGIPWASFVAEKLELPLMYVRANLKDHGAGKYCDGYAPEGSTVLLVEDLFTSGGSAKTSIEHLRNDGFKCNHCVGIFTYGKPIVEQTFNELNVESATLTNVDETLAEAQTQSLLSDDQVKIVEAWIKEQRT